jgi:hypothetical protein
VESPPLQIQVAEKTGGNWKQLSSQELIKVVLELPIDRQLALTNAITQSFGQELLSRAA